jgi:cell division protein FtsB
MQLLVLLGAWVLASVALTLAWIAYRTWVARFSVEDFDAVDLQVLPASPPLISAER